jgi:uncharacterized protein
MAASKKAARKQAAGEGGPPKKSRRPVEKTADGRHVIIEGRRWRATNPALPEDERRRLVKELMAARRAVGQALREGDAEAEARARRRVHDAKVALGERGPKWWEEEEEESAEVRMRNAE